MLKISNMLIIGATGRNIGKTEYACRIIQKYSKSNQRVIAIKVTTIKEKDGKCPSGGEGCGVCISLKGDYSLTHETMGPAGKDTTKMIEAGADKVYWLRVLEAKLKQGIKEFLKLVSKDDVIICESNSLRSIIEPGLFLVINKKGNNLIKTSCKAVINYADKIIEASDNTWDLLPTDLIFNNSEWFYPFKTTAAILAGGESKRFGQDKSLIKINNIPMIEHIKNQIKPYFKEILISSNDAQKYKFLGLQVIKDLQQYQGPLMAIYSILQAIKTDKVFIVSCDTPNINISIIKKLFQQGEYPKKGSMKMIHYDVVIPQWKNNNLEPLFAIYSKSCIPYIKKALYNNQRRIISFISGHNQTDMHNSRDIKVKYIRPGNSDWYKNINYKEDYEEYVKNG